LLLKYGSATVVGGWLFQLFSGCTVEGYTRVVFKSSVLEEVAAAMEKSMFERENTERLAAVAANRKAAVAAKQVEASVVSAAVHSDAGDSSDTESTESSGSSKTYTSSSVSAGVKRRVRSTSARLSTPRGVSFDPVNRGRPQLERLRSCFSELDVRWNANGFQVASVRMFASGIDETWLQRKKQAKELVYLKEQELEVLARLKELVGNGIMWLTAFVEANPRMTRGVLVLLEEERDFDHVAVFLEHMLADEASDLVVVPEGLIELFISCLMSWNETAAQEDRAHEEYSKLLIRAVLYWVHQVKWSQAGDEEDFEIRMMSVEIASDASDDGVVQWGRDRVISGASDGDVSGDEVITLEVVQGDVHIPRYVPVAEVFAVDERGALGARVTDATDADLEVACETDDVNINAVGDETDVEVLQAPKAALPTIRMEPHPKGWVSP